jgi:predicted ferric reductase
MMKIRAVLESVVAGVIAAIFSYSALITPAIIAALALRRKMPDAWFSGLITWYAMFIVLGVSLVIAGVACRMVYKQVVGSTKL